MCFFICVEVFISKVEECFNYLLYIEYNGGRGGLVGRMVGEWIVIMVKGKGNREWV